MQPATAHAINVCIEFFQISDEGASRATTRTHLPSCAGNDGILALKPTFTTNATHGGYILGME